MPCEPLPKPLRGIVPPMLTPLADRDALDVPGLERLIEHILRGGVHGLFILGTTGEGPSLSYRLRRELVDRTVQQVAGRVPVLVGITDTAFVESLALARHAAEVGADAVVLAPPYYMPEGQPELREFLGHLVPELPLPLYLYNMPPLTKVPFEVETVRWAMDQPGVLGLKDSSGDLGYFNRLCALLPARPDWALLIGPEQLLAQAMLAGGSRRRPRRRERVSASSRRALRGGRGRRLRPRPGAPGAGADGLGALVPRRQASIRGHQGDQVRRLVPRNLQRLHGRAVPPLP